MRTLTVRPASIAATLVVATALAACGSSSLTGPSTGASSGGGSGLSTNLARIHIESLRLSRCMRADDVPNFPDPPADGGFGVKSFAQRSHGKTMSINGVPVSGPGFRSAIAKCQHYMPQKPAPTNSQLALHRTEAAQYGRCMRNHRINIPDPKIEPASGGIGVQIDIPIGMTQNSPAFKAADQTCQRRTRF
ncbi:MAG TPA: hypothetical protein VMV16_06165 [Solirubrobacteraceae bacterium]|nr:hypothetical protein [Solirubrobacteraceae bacterium]